MPTPPSNTFLAHSPGPNDQVDIAALFERSFHVRHSAAQWGWKYGANPNGQGAATISRAPDGTLAAHCSGYPVRFYDAERGGRIALQIGDIMTAREFRGVGRGPTSVMARTTAQFYRDHCASKVDFNYGFNTASSKGFSLRFMGAQEVEDAPLWRCPAEHFIPTSSAARYTVRRIDAFTNSEREAFNGLFEQVAPEYGPLVQRDVDWLRWRYLEFPDQPSFQIYGAYRRNQLVGWSIFRLRDSVLRWCDALVTPKHSACAAALIHVALAANTASAKGQPVQSVEGWFSERPTWWASQLRELGFERASEPNGIGMVCVPHMDQLAVELLQKSYYTWGDSDLA